MKHFLYNFNKYIFFFLVILFISCEDSSPSIANIRHIVLYEYANENELSSVRLAVYVQLLSDPFRIEAIEITSPNNSFSWNIDNPEDIMNKDIVWVGSSNIKPSRGESFANGTYSFRYTDVAQRNTELFFTVNAKENLSTINKSEYTDKFIGIYNDSDVLIYFGSDAELQTSSEILEAYPLAKYKRTILLSSYDDSAILKPIQKLQDGE